MVAFNFKAQWASLVEDGIKRQTVRAGLRAQPGTMLQHYTGMRTKACRKLREDVRCAEVVDFWRGAGRIFYMSDSDNGCVSHYWQGCIDEVSPALRYGVRRGTYQVTAGLFALLDGFGERLEQLLAFFQPGFSGWLYRWDVPVLRWTADQWLFVYAGGARRPFDSSYRAPSGRLYGVGAQDGAGNIGLMQGIPADWTEVA
jgi:hypothetical protein